MKLSKHLQAFASDWANFVALATRELPFLQFRNPSLYSIFSKYCAGNRFADRALQLGDGPVLHVDVGALDPDSSNNAVTDIRVPTRGARSPILKQNIYFQVEVVYEYERNVAVMRPYMEALVLHELIHWARFVSGAPFRVPAKYADGEAGNEFEFEAYGMDMSRRWTRAARFLN